MTVGPFFPREFSPAAAGDLTQLEGRKAQGEEIEVCGRVTQADGAPLHNLVIELWQADARGAYAGAAGPGFFGWGRAATDKDGIYRFRTVRPGARDGRAAHLNLLLLFSGLMHQLQTVMFFADAPADPVYLTVPPARRHLLVAKQEAPGRYRFDIRLRGEGETPFFDD